MTKCMNTIANLKYIYLICLKLNDTFWKVLAHINQQIFLIDVYVMITNHWVKISSDDRAPHTLQVEYLLLVLTIVMAVGI